MYDLLLITKEENVKDSWCKRLIIQNGDIRSLGSRSPDKESEVKWKFEGMKNVENKVYLVYSFGLLTSPTSRCTYIRKTERVFYSCLLSECIQK